MLPIFLLADGSRGLRPETKRDREREARSGEKERRRREGGEGRGETGLLPTYKLYALNEIYG